MRPFRERNPLPIGIAGLATVGLLAALAFNLGGFSGGTSYSAAFSEAAGLKSGEEVRIAGVKVGKVEGVTLEGDHVKVKFTSGTPFGTDSRVQIKIKTLLGSHYLALEPKGPGRQSAHREIPVSRTTAPYDVVPALQDSRSPRGIRGRAPRRAACCSGPCGTGCRSGGSGAGRRCRSPSRRWPGGASSHFGTFPTGARAGPSGHRTRPPSGGTARTRSRTAPARAGRAAAASRSPSRARAADTGRAAHGSRECLPPRTA